MPHTVTERHIQTAVLLALGCEPDVTLWRVNTGAIRDDRGRLVRFGLCVGGSDILGILAPTGRWLAIEVKCRARVTDEQEAFLALVRRRGGFGCVLRATNADTAARLAHEALARARRGESE